MPNIELLNIPPQDVPVLWPTVYPYLEKAVDMAGEYDSQTLLSACYAGRFQVWVVGVDDEVFACFTTSIRVFPKKRVLECVHLGGKDIQVWGEFVVDKLSNFAKENSCSSLVVDGRAGIEKVYKQWGFEKDSVVMRKVL